MVDIGLSNNSWLKSPEVATPKYKPTILFVDQALTFGGSIVVLGSLVEAIDKQLFRSVVVGEMSRSIINYHIQDNAKIYVVRRLFNYVLWKKVAKLTSRIHAGLLRKLVIYFL